MPTIHTNQFPSLFTFRKDSDREYIHIYCERANRVELCIEMHQPSPATDIAGAKFHVTHGGSIPVPLETISVVGNEPSWVSLVDGYVVLEDGHQNHLVTVTVDDPPPILTFTFVTSAFPSSDGDAYVSGELYWR